MSEEDEIIEDFKTKRERNKEQNAKYQREYKLRHNVKTFRAHFKDTEGLDRILERLRQDGVTNKEFILRSFERYEKDGGFGGNQS